MYNLIVIGYEDESWLDHRVVKMATNRFLEYTKEYIVEEFRHHIEGIHKYPCLIMKEGDNPDIYLCRISNISSNESHYKISFQTINNISFKYSEIKLLLKDLDIRKLEMTRTHWALKEADLPKVLTSSKSNLSEENKLSIQNYFIRNIQYIDVEGSVHSCFGALEAHLNYSNRSENIESVTDFIAKILSNDNESDEGYVNFYRGHSSSKYKLEPSLFRKTKDGNFQYLENEYIIYNELLTQNYSEFGADSSTFDRLVRMQHFSLPTRLLDISTNPLIALYFACKGNEKLSGDVILIQVPRNKIKYFDSDTATCIANLCKLTNKAKESLSAGVLDANYKNAKRKLYHCIKDDKPYFQEIIKKGSINEILCIKGKITNSRINAQSGAFLLFGLDAVLKDKNIFGLKITHYLIEADTKKKILMELDLLNINESTLFPYLENSAKYISNKFQKI